ncbi:MAG: hypothetical protein AAF846_17035 [Chloroflexota bacterium]
MRRIDLIEQRDTQMMMSPEKEKNKNGVMKPPTNPWLLGFLTILLTPLVSVILLGMNWKKLGKKGWGWRTILTWSLGSIGIIGGIIITLILGVFTVMDAETNMVMGISLVVMLLWIVLYPLAIAGIQYGGYKKYQHLGLRGASKHSYSAVTSVLLLTIVVGVFSTLVGITGYDNPDPYQDERISLEIPFALSDEPDNQKNYYDCTDIGEHCRLMVSDGYGNLYISFLDELWVQDEARSLEGMADAMWDFARTTKGNIALARDTVMIGVNEQYEAHTVTFYNDGWYTVHYLIEDDDDNQYFITVEGYSENSVVKNQFLIDEMLESFSFDPQ